MKIFLAGHNGMVGSAIYRKIKNSYNDIYDLVTTDRDELDLLNQDNVRSFFSEIKPDALIIAAAKVGGIHANNNYPAEFIYENICIQNNLIHEANNLDINKILFLGSSCIYPRNAKQPMSEDELLSGALEPTNEPYAIAKIAGIKMCESYNRQYGRDYRSIMPTNLYGPGDNFHDQNAHVLPALLRRFHEASQKNLPNVTIWGTGSVFREFLHVDDMASASMFLFDVDESFYKKNTSPMQSHINVGTGDEVSIKELAEIIAEITNFQGELIFDSSKPDGTPRKLLDSSKIYNMGWEKSIELKEGIRMTYEWFKGSHDVRR
jgi:GDP-L-fucose synthase